MKSPYKIIESFFAKERSPSQLNRVIDFVVYAISFAVFPFELVIFKKPWQDTFFGLIQADWQIGGQIKLSLADIRAGRVHDDLEK